MPPSGQHYNDMIMLSSDTKTSKSIFIDIQKLSCFNNNFQVTGIELLFFFSQVQINQAKTIQFKLDW